jgi:hypothetical protein
MHGRQSREHTHGKQAGAVSARGEWAQRAQAEKKELFSCASTSGWNFNFTEEHCRTQFGHMCNMAQPLPAFGDGLSSSALAPANSRTSSNHRHASACK